MNKELAKLINLDKAMKTEDVTLNWNQLITFAYIAIDEGCSVTNIADKLKQPHNTVSKNVRSLTAKDYKGGDGQFLVEQKIDALNPKYRLCHLTSKGKMLQQRLAAVLAN